jgi:hypothetical protein
LPREQDAAHTASQLQRIWPASMKTSNFPSLRVDPALRKAAEDVLREGESLSGFVEQSIRAQIDLRQQQEAFVARGLASRDDARRTGVYHDATEVVGELRAALRHAKAEAKGRR